MSRPDVDMLMREARRLKGEGKLEAAIDLYVRVVELAPQSSIAEHNLAAALGDAGRWLEAEPHLRAVFAKGGDAPESWLVFARCLMAVDRLDEAETAFRQAVRRRPGFQVALRELAQLRWMRTADADAALVDLDAGIRAAPGDAGLVLLRAQALEQMGRVAEALDQLLQLAAQTPGNAAVATVAAQCALAAGDADLALRQAERAVLLAPREVVPETALIEACLAAGDAVRAERLAAALRDQHPLNQHAIALQATAWRLLDDVRYRDVVDYDALVSVQQIATPRGWNDINTYLADLARALTASHRFRTHPFNQSVREGSQSVDILAASDPALRAIPEALDPPIRAYLAALGQGGDPLRARNRGGYAFNGMWSIRLKAGGRHINHVHPQGWISSACYVETPDGEGKQGWLAFGEPGVRTKRPLSAERFVRPQPGALVLFPSYLWHGTLPFEGERTRLTFAFDLAPADATDGGGGGPAGVPRRTAHAEARVCSPASGSPGSH